MEGNLFWDEILGNRTGSLGRMDQGKKKGGKIQRYIIKVFAMVEVWLDPTGNPLKTYGKCKMVYPRNIRVFIKVALWSVNASHKIVYVLEYLNSFQRDSTQQFQRSLKAGNE